MDVRRLRLEDVEELVRGTFAGKELGRGGRVGGDVVLVGRGVRPVVGARRRRRWRCHGLEVVRLVVRVKNLGEDVGGREREGCPGGCLRVIAW